MARLCRVAENASSGLAVVEPPFSGALLCPFVGGLLDSATRAAGCSLVNALTKRMTSASAGVVPLRFSPARTMPARSSASGLIGRLCDKGLMGWFVMGDLTIYINIQDVWISGNVGNLENEKHEDRIYQSQRQNSNRN